MPFALATVSGDDLVPVDVMEEKAGRKLELARAAQQHIYIYIYKSVILNVCIHTTFHSYLHHALLIFEKATNSILCNFLFLLLCAEPPALPVAPHAEFRSG